MKNKDRKLMRNHDLTRAGADAGDPAAGLLPDIPWIGKTTPPPAPLPTPLTPHPTPPHTGSLDPYPWFPFQSTAPTPGHMPYSAYRPGDDTSNDVTDNARTKTRPPGLSALIDDDWSYEWTRNEEL